MGWGNGEDKVAKDLGDFWTGQQTGVNTSGTTSGAMGAATSSTSKKVICTELRRQGLFSRADHLAGARYVQDNLTARHENGYHAWGLFVVKRMRRSKGWTAVFRVLAQARADHIAWLDGDSSRKNNFGRVLCAVGEPVCFLIGGFVGQEDWARLYNASADKRTRTISS